MSETNQPANAATTSTGAVSVSSAPASTAPATKKPPLTIFQQAEFVCSCNRIMSKLEFVKANGVFTGEVIVKCPGNAACQNGGKRIKVKALVVEAEEL